MTIRSPLSSSLVSRLGEEDRGIIAKRHNLIIRKRRKIQERFFVIFFFVTVIFILCIKITKLYRFLNSDMGVKFWILHPPPSAAPCDGYQQMVPETRLFYEDFVVLINMIIVIVFLCVCHVSRHFIACWCMMILLHEMDVWYMRNRSLIIWLHWNFILLILIRSKSM